MKILLSLLSRRSQVALSVFTLIGGFICFWALSADVDCGAQSWDCANFLGIGIVALIGGLGIGLAITGLTILLSFLIQLTGPKAWWLEPVSKAPAVGLTLVILHLVPFAVLHVFGALPVGWPWWLGIFGAFPEQSTGPFNYVK